MILKRTIFFGAKNDENFVYDNERNGHYTYLDKFKISKYLVTNAEYLSSLAITVTKILNFGFQMGLIG